MSSRSQASATATTTAQSSPFTFADIPSTSTCAGAVISWNRTGGDLTFSLFLVPSSRPPTTLALVAYAIDTAVGSFDWHPVNVTPGVYQLNAIGTGFSVLSPAFVVSNGTDASCLPSPSRNSSNPFTSLTTASGPSSSHGISPGAIIGAVLGGVAFVAVMLGLCIYLRLRRGAVLGYCWRSCQHSESARAPGRWSGLSSHVNITTQAPSMSLQDERPAGLTDAPDDGTRQAGIPLTALPRLQPNRRKPSVSASSALLEHREPRPVPSPAPSVHAPAPRASTLRLDDELPLPPTSFVAPVERLRAMHGARPARRPSATSAVPSSATSQMYRVRDSMWLPPPRSPSIPPRLGPGGPSPSGAFLGAREGGSPRDALQGGPVWDQVP
ncbi:hypothetical protein BD413DRAFT_490408 [Trametes elegans]|nr:hypothetical protein BD413DRAFT_490408 [Trametes elegans]